MTDIVLYDKSGNPVTYSNVDTLITDTPDGETQETFTHGELLEGMEIDPDFSEGNQTVNVPEGYLVRSAVVNVPENLKAENIAEGVEVAGIVGTHRGGLGSEAEALLTAEVDILPTTDLTFTFNSFYNAYMDDSPTDIETLVEGETYYVQFGDQLYECVAAAATANDMTAVAIGDVGIFEGNPSGSYPFATTIVGPDQGLDGFYLATFTTFTEETTVPVRIYQIVPGISFNNLLDKPFYSEQTTVEVFPEQTVVSFTDGECYIRLVIEEGTQYKVRWDGVEYELTAASYSYEGFSVVYVGNTSIIDTSGENTGEAFLIAYADAEQMAIIASSDTEATSHTFGITKEAEFIKTLDPKYSPVPVTVAPGSNNVLLPSLELEFTYNSGIFMFMESVTTEMHSAWEDDWATCKVSWNGTEYICTPQVVDGEKCVGNVDFANGTGNSGEPFIIGIFVDNGGPSAVIYDLGTSTEGAVDGETTTTNTVEVTLVTPERTVVDPDAIPEIDYETKIINKPFGVIPAGTVLAEGVADCQDAFSDPMYYTLIDELSIVVGGSYSVEWDGGTYIIDAMELMSGVTGIVQIDSDPPFGFVNGYMPGYTLVIGLQGTHTFKVSSAAEIVKKIDSKYLSSSMPAVTTADNGKVMSVVNGAWAASAAPSSMPAVTTADNGKFLRVVNGNWTAVTIPNAEEASF